MTQFSGGRLIQDVLALCKRVLRYNTGTIQPASPYISPNIEVSVDNETSLLPWDTIGLTMRPESGSGTFLFEYSFNGTTWATLAGPYSVAAATRLTPARVELFAPFCRFRINATTALTFAEPVVVTLRS